MKSGHSRAVLSRRKLMCLAATALAVPGVPVLAASRTLSGRVSIRERIALPPEALLEVRLIDVSAADAPGRSLAVTRVKTRHRMPIPYRLRFNEAKIQSGHNYALHARITVGGKLWFVSTSRYPVFSDKSDETDIRVDFVKPASAAPAALSGRWRAEAIRRHGVAGDLESIIEIASRRQGDRQRRLQPDQRRGDGHRRPYDIRADHFDQDGLRTGHHGS